MNAFTDDFRDMVRKEIERTIDDHIGDNTKTSEDYEIEVYDPKTMLFVSGMVSVAYDVEWREYDYMQEGYVRTVEDWWFESEDAAIVEISNGADTLMQLPVLTMQY